MAEKPTYKELVSRVKKLEKKPLNTNGQRQNCSKVKSSSILLGTRQIFRVGGWEWDVQNQTMFWTEETYRIHGFKPNEIEPVSKKHIERSLICFDEKDRPIILEAFQKCIREGIPYDMEFPFTTEKDKKIWVRTTAKAIKKNGKVIHVLGNIADITEYKQLEEKLSMTAEEWQITFDATQSCILILDKNNLILRANRAAEKMLQCSEKEIVGKICWEVVHGTNHPIPECPIIRAKESLQRESIELQLNQEWIEITADPILDENGEYTKAIHIITDITDRKKAQQSLKESEENLRMLMESAEGFAVYQLGYDKNPPLMARVVFVSPSINNLIGINDATRLENWFQNVHPDDADRVLKSHLKAWNEGGTLNEIARVFHPAKKEWRWIHGIANGILDPQNVFSRCNGILIDITEYKQAEEEKRNALEFAAEQSKSLEKMNTALKVLIEHHDKEKKKIENNILANVNKLILPYISKMQKSGLDINKQTYLSIIKSNLENLISPFAENLSLSSKGLTSREIQIADLIKHGKTSKEIAELLDVSFHAVSVYRYKIRKKLHLLNEKINLRSYLQNIG